jgi:hypothetical protein
MNDECRLADDQAVFSSLLMDASSLNRHLEIRDSGFSSLWRAAPFLLGNVISFR